MLSVWTGTDTHQTNYYLDHELNIADQTVFAVITVGTPIPGLGHFIARSEMTFDTYEDAERFMFEYGDAYFTMTVQEYAPIPF